MHTPSKPPISTCRGVCPSTSFSFLPLTVGWSSSTLFTTAFNTCACSPACRRTPIASYMTITVKHVHAANKLDDRPWWIATAVVIAAHSEECDDGIPPESKNAVGSNTLVLYHFVNIFAACATNQPTNR